MLEASWKNFPVDNGILARWTLEIALSGARLSMLFRHAESRGMRRTDSAAFEVNEPLISPLKCNFAEARTRFTHAIGGCSNIEAAIVTDPKSESDGRIGRPCGECRSRTNHVAPAQVFLDDIDIASRVLIDGGE